jgi:putative ABC transport system permease protein
LFRLVIRRMSSNLWMVICLLLGTMLATSLVCSIPLYTDGIMQRMLTKDLENYQVEKGNFPGTFSVKAVLNYAYEGKDRGNALRYFRNRIWNVMGEAYNVPYLTKVEEIRVSHSTVLSDPPDIKRPDGYFAEMGYRSGLPEHSKVTNGRMYSDVLVDGVTEVVVSARTMKDQNLLLDHAYTISSKLSKEVRITKIRVVGVIEASDPSDPYWTRSLSEGTGVFYMSEKIFVPDFVVKGSPFLREASWFYAFDYHQIKVDNLAHIIETWNSQLELVKKYRGVLESKMPALDIISTYHDRAGQLTTTLWVLAVPVLLMLVFYIFMVSQLIIGADENGIAVLKSRGASKTQIFFSYLVESILLGVVAVASGPPLGLMLCQVLGASNGFLEFVQRTALPLKMNASAYLYAGAAFLLIVVTMMIPVVMASRTTIVKVKQGRARSNKRTFWKKYFLDIIVLGIAFYGLYQFQRQQGILAATGISADQIQVDPLLFLTSTLFVLGAGLLFLRIYPFLIRFIYWTGRRIWSPVLYVSLVQVGRSRGQEQFLMLFIILSISIGLFNANSARTTNRNVEDKTHYSVGADVRIMPNWKTDDVASSGPPTGAPAVATFSDRAIKYIEPNYKAFASLKGIQIATKVLPIKDVRVRAYDTEAIGVRILAVNPAEFGQIAWFRTDLLPYHWFEYLNLMTDAPKAVLLSANLKEQLKVKEGDTISLSWAGNNSIEATIYAFVDYWPTFNPNPKIDSSKTTETGAPALGSKPGLVVANFDYLMSKLPIQPYEIWMKKVPGTTDKVIYDDINSKTLDINTITYVNQQLIKMKNDPMLQGINGSLTLGFVSAMAISLLGFLIYWIISIQARVLHFGILRAMGLSLSKVIGMIACEQVLVSGAAVAMGFFIGNLASRLFIPLLQVASSAADQVPPFRIVSQVEDYYKIYAVVAAMLVIGFITLWRIIARIRIDQALKLGED